MDMAQQVALSPGHWLLAEHSPQAPRGSPPLVKGRQVSAPQERPQPPQFRASVAMSTQRPPQQRSAASPQTFPSWLPRMQLRLSRPVSSTQVPRRQMWSTTCHCWLPRVAQGAASQAPMAVASEGPQRLPSVVMGQLCSSISSRTSQPPAVQVGILRTRVCVPVSAQGSAAWQGLQGPVLTSPQSPSPVHPAQLRSASLQSPSQGALRCWVQLPRVQKSSPLQKMPSSQAAPSWGEAMQRSPSQRATVQGLPSSQGARSQVGGPEEQPALASQCSPGGQAP